MKRDDIKVGVPHAWQRTAYDGRQGRGIRVVPIVVGLSQRESNRRIADMQGRTYSSFYRDSKTPGFALCEHWSEDGSIMRGHVTVPHRQIKKTWEQLLDERVRIEEAEAKREASYVARRAESMPVVAAANRLMGKLFFQVDDRGKITFSWQADAEEMARRIVEMQP